MSEETPLTGMMMDAVDYNNKPVTIYSTTGKAVTEADFSKAMSDFNTSKGTIPKGYTVLEPGAMDWMRSKFESAQKVIQPQFTKFGESMGETLAAPFTLAGQAIGGPTQEYTEAGRQAAVQTGGKVGEFLGEQVKTPGRAAATVATAALPATRAPSVINKLGNVVLSPKNVALNVAEEAVKGAGAYALGEAATGNVITPGEAAVQAVVYGSGGGLQSLFGHFVSKHVPKQRQNEVAQGLIDIVEGTKPTAGSTPYTFDQVGSTSANFGEMVQKGADGLRGGIDDVVHTFVTDINAALPRNLTVPQQATLRSHLREVYSSGNNVLNNLGKPEEYTKAVDAYNKSVVTVRDFVRSAYPNISNIQPTVQRVEAVLQDKTSQLQQFTNGAEVLSLYKEAGQEGGFNPVKLHDILRTRYLGTQNPAMTESGKVLGQTQSLLDIPEGGVGQQQPSLVGMLTDFARNKVPGGKFIPSMGRTEATPGVMPWQVPVDVNSPTARIGAQLTGQGTIRSLEQTQADQRNQQQKNAVKQFVKP